MKKILFDEYSPIGLKIRTTKLYWELIKLKHPEVANKLFLIKSTIKMPDSVRRSKTDKSVHLFYKKINGYWICVVTKCSIKDGFIITAYITDKIKEGEKIWPN